MLAIVFLAALIPRVVITLTAPHPPCAHWDVAHDVVIARNLAQGHGFCNEPGHPTAFRYPLVPAILSVFFRVLGERYIPFLLFQSLLGAVVASVVAFMGTVAGGRKLGFAVRTARRLRQRVDLHIQDDAHRDDLLLPARCHRPGLLLDNGEKKGRHPAACRRLPARPRRPMQTCRLGMGACWHWLCS
ncbi:MAG: hypothetical protein BWX71_01712 [Deltaproteobacteria bacterium ADurb.Bin072]|nr:MAG: hypothetical protein BWX71_01712 [Deltaproteobacteria bacterium ADurb.Bin072]